MTVWLASSNAGLTAGNAFSQVDATSILRSEAGNTALTTAFVSSSAFTPGAITIDGIAVEIASRAASPSGTISVQLANGGVAVAGTTVTINVSDLPTCTATSGTTTWVITAEGGWIFFKFAAPVTLLAATAYTLQAKTSVASQVNLWTNGTAANWSRLLRTTTTGNPAASDDFHISGEWTAAATMTARTVTMDNTAGTIYGSNTTSQYTPAIAISIGGTLVCGTSASTNYTLNVKGYIIIYNGGLFETGYASGTPIPGTSTATISQICTADGDFGIVARNGAKWHSSGVPRTSGKLKTWTLLTADMAAGANSSTVADDTGWLSGDVVVLPSTDTTYNHTDKMTLNANATFSGLSYSSTTTNAHKGTAPIYQGEVLLLTRNVVYTGGSTTVQPFTVTGQLLMDIDLQWTEFNEYGTNATSTTGKVCMSVNNLSGTFNMQYCSVHDCRGLAISINNVGFQGINGVTIQYLTMYNINSASSISGHGIAVTGARQSGLTPGQGYKIDNCAFCILASASNTCSTIVLSDDGGTVTNNRIASSQGNSPLLVQASGNAPYPNWGVINNNNIHSCPQNGLVFSNASWGTMSGFVIWALGSTGLVLAASPPNADLFYAYYQKFVNFTVVGCPTGFSVPTGSGIWIFDNCKFAGTTTTAMSTLGSGGTEGSIIRFFSCSIGVATGIFTTIANYWNFGGQTGVSDLLWDNCLIGTDPPVFANQGGQYGTYARFQNYNQVANDNRNYVLSDNNAFTTSVIRTDTSVVYNAAVSPRSVKMMPGNYTTNRMYSDTIPIAVKTGQKATLQLQIQINSAYGGGGPQVWIKRQDSMGQTSDAVLATCTTTPNVWQTITVQSPAAPQDGVYEFFVTCDQPSNSSTAAVWIDGEIATAA